MSFGIYLAVCLILIASLAKQWQANLKVFR